MRNKIIAFDLDGTLCERPDGIEDLGPKKYDYCTPKQDMIDILNELHSKGYVIIIYTARGMGQFRGDVNKVYDELFEITVESLNRWGIKYHQLVMGKIDYDMLIDDKAMGIDNLEIIRNL
jgi:FMN phosphatase YigB (HAD superfamily)